MLMSDRRQQNSVKQLTINEKINLFEKAEKKKKKRPFLTLIKVPSELVVVPFFSPTPYMYKDNWS